GVSVRLIQGPWHEKSVTANTLPPIAAAALDQKTITTANQGQLVSFDVSAVLAAWRSNPNGNFGLPIVAASPTPNVQLGSREGGSPAILSFGGPAADNDVKVAPSGGDYTDPLTAVNNAFQGDTWCVAPPVGEPCTVHIAAGVYPL